MHPGFTGAAHRRLTALRIQEINVKLHLTEKALNGIELGERPNLKVYDSEVTGFGCQLTRKGAGSYFISYRNDQGRSKQERIGQLGKLAAHQARELAQQKLQEIGARAKAMRTARPGHCMTCSAFFNKTYLPEVKASGAQSQTHASIWRNHLEKEIGHLRLDEVTVECVRAIRVSLLNKVVAGGKWQTQSGKTLAQGTVTRILILVRHFFNMALREKVAGLHVNPTIGMNLNQDSQEVKGQFLTREELKRLMSVARDKDPVMLDVLMVSSLTGLRRGNVLGMRWDWIDLERGTVRLPSLEMKSRKFTVKHLGDPVVTLLRRRWEAAVAESKASPDQKWLKEWVFPNPKTGKPYHSRRCLWETIRKDAGLDKVRMHDLRHTFASMMIESGRSLLDVKESLGHTQISTTMKYLHLAEQRRKETEDCTAAYIGL